MAKEGQEETSPRRTKTKILERLRWGSSDSEKLVAEVKEARRAGVFSENVRDKVCASLVNWFDVASLEEVTDVVKRETNVSAFGWDKWRLNKFDCGNVVCEHLGRLGWREPEVAVEVSKVHEGFGALGHGDVFTLKWAERSARGFCLGVREEWSCVSVRWSDCECVC